MSLLSQPSVGQRLLRERQRLNWSQERLAEELGVSTHSINRWEKDKVLPHPHYREQLCQIFNKSSAELGFAPTEDKPESPAPTQSVWTVPHRRNIYFTGREDAIQFLRDTFTTRKTGAVLRIGAITGLGGIGKTQVAVEYACRYADEYTTVLWAHADSYSTLTTDFVTFSRAELLNLPEKAGSDQAQIVASVKRWLQQHKAWLLILDNADDIEIVDDFMPMRGDGHILLTTRSQLTGPDMKSFEIEKMGAEEGALLLLRRAKIIAEDAPLAAARDDDRTSATALCTLLGGLPLALDQAAAYIDERQSSLEAYRKLYQTHRESLLKQRGAFGRRDYPRSVATTWSLSFEQLAQTDDAAADLLRLCAFLYPDAIPEGMIIAGVNNASSGLQHFAQNQFLFDRAIGSLRRYSLLRRNPSTRQLTMHRLVQATLKDAMSKETHRLWAERAVRVVSEAFPQVTFASWPVCQEYLPHALSAAELIELWDMQFLEAARLLDRTSNYLLDHARYPQAEILSRRALRMREQIQGSEHLDTARTLHWLAVVCAAQSKYDEAEPLFQRALAIYECLAGPTEAELAKILSGLAILYDDQGKYEQARLLHKRALAIYEALPDPDAVEMSECLSNMALHYFDLAEYGQAESLYKRALAIQESSPNPNHPGYSHTLHNLATLYFRQGQYEQAEPLYARALTIREQALGPYHPRVAATLNNLAVLYERQNKLSESIQFYLHALAIREQTLSPTHLDVANSLHNVATCFYLQGQYEQAESYYQRSLAIHEQALGPDHPYVAHNLNGLARLYTAEGHHDRAAALFQRALAIQEQHLGPEHLDIATTLERYANLLKLMAQNEQAALFEQRARTIRARHS